MAKRSIVYEEIGDRLGTGRKDGDRTELRGTKYGLDSEMVKYVSRLAKEVVINRHWAEVQQVFAHEAEFFRALRLWQQEQGDWGLKGKLPDLIARYYEAHGMTRGEQTKPTPAATDKTPAMFLSSGRPRPQRRPR